MRPLSDARIRRPRATNTNSRCNPRCASITRLATSFSTNTRSSLARTRDYEEDLLMPLCLAGAPPDPANLWPQPRFGDWSADRKDKLEAKLCRFVCDGRVPLARAQREIATDWIPSYRKYIGAGSRKTASRKVRSGP
jgi:hypothetical protein